ncbi:hypothetical protein OS493_023834 [Desmophyllum pertusum]|uniref:Uncharacterized protein n=1 Tax=Desmophyllum pertusum TaxID=174260 RepID=A0A9W9YM36_9CNID|nr:hypothetical protein OS493_023834 [Desmophyllum pertusum]
MPFKNDGFLATYRQLNYTPPVCSHSCKPNSSATVTRKIKQSKLSYEGQLYRVPELHLDHYWLSKRVCGRARITLIFALGCMCARLAARNRCTLCAEGCKNGALGKALLRLGAIFGKGLSFLNETILDERQQMFVKFAFWVKTL